MRKLLLATLLLATPIRSADLSSLGLADWQVIREKPSDVLIAKDHLKLRTQPGRIWAGNDARNVLVSEPISAKPLQLSARVRLIDPSTKYEQAGLLCYVHDDWFVKIIVEHIDGEAWVVSAIEGPPRRKLLSKERVSGFEVGLSLEVHGDVVLCHYQEPGKPRRFACSVELPAKEKRRLGLFTQDGPADEANFATFSKIAVAEAPLVLTETRKVAADCKFTEGPALSPAGDLYFSDGPNDRIVKLDKHGKQSVYLTPCGVANGLLFDSQGRLLMCQSSREGGGRALARMKLTDPKPTILTRQFEGNRYIAPNDLCIDGKGRIYFTDPYYSGEKSQPVAGVYRHDPDGKVTRLVGDLLKPNGILLTPDSTTLYVSDRGTQKLHRYRVNENGELKPDGILYDFSPDRGIDGMWMDELGNIYGAAGKGATTGLFVISPDGHLLLHKPMPEFSTNVIIGGNDLYLTASTSVYHLKTRFRSAELPPPLED